MTWSWYGIVWEKTNKGEKGLNKTKRVGIGEREGCFRMFWSLQQRI